MIEPCAVVEIRKSRELLGLLAVETVGLQRGAWSGWRDGRSRFCNIFTVRIVVVSMQDIAGSIGDGANAAKVVRHEETVVAICHIAAGDEDAIQ